MLTAFKNCSLKTDWQLFFIGLQTVGDCKKNFFFFESTQYKLDALNVVKSV
jgi:hypothetical protein